MIGLIISTVTGPNLTSCHVKLILVPHSKTWRFWFIYSDVLFKNLTGKKCVLVSEFTSVKHGTIVKYGALEAGLIFRRSLA